jgi:membrane AbrB-like protein
VTLVVGLSAALTAVGSPTPLLFGGLLGGLVFALGTPLEVSVPPWSFTTGQAIIGVTIGSMVAWGTLVDLGTDWPAVALISVATLVLSVAAGQALRLHRGISAVTAAFSTVAGGASGMTAIAQDLGADDRVVTVVQYLRVLAILLAMPAVVSTVFDASAGSGAAPAGAATTPTTVGFSLVAVVAGVVVGRVLHLPSPALLGPLLVAAGLAALPAFDDVGVPAWIQGIAYVLVGVQVGLKFTVESLRMIGRMLPTALLVIAVIVAGSAACGVLLAQLTGVSQLDAYLATTPGGLYAVLATSADTGGNVTFVTAAQLIRLLLVLIAAPLLASWLTGRRR